jgi:quaternary ammonium compound-resistance protein SugE
MTAATDAATPAAVKNKSAAWLALLVAGAFEVGYALSVNGSHGFTESRWSVSAFIFFLLTLFFLSVALKGIDVGIGYAVWAGIGAIGAAVLGPVFFDESLTPAKALWLAVIIAGVVWLKLADSPRLTATAEHHSDHSGALRSRPSARRSSRTAREGR